MAKEERRAIRMPGSVLDQIRTKEESGEYGKDARFARKRKMRQDRPVSRKGKRKEERQLKKQKQSKQTKFQNQHNSGKDGFAAHTKNHHSNKKAKSGSPQTEENDPIAALKALKAKKSQKSKKKSSSELKIVRESDLEDASDFDADDFSDDVEDTETASRKGDSSKTSSKNGNNSKSGLRIVKEDELESDNDDFSDFSADDDESLSGEDFEEFGDEDENEDDIEESDPLAALAKLKAKKNAKNGKPSKPQEQPDEESEDDFSNADSDFGNDFDSDFDEEMEEEEESDPLAKLKALKEAKKNKSKGEEKREKSNSKKEKVIEADFGGDDIDREMEYYAKKLGLKDGKKSKLTKLDDDDVVGGLLDGLDLDFDDDDDNNSKFASDSEGFENSEDGFGNSEDFDDYSDEENAPKKENPFIAPASEDASNENDSGAESKPSKYIPPAMRRKLALESSGVSAETLALQKSIKGPINKLSEANIGPIANEINALFLSNPRQSVNENLTSIILDSVVQQGRLLDTFVYLHSALVAAIYRMQGVDFGAHFVQTLVEKLESSRKSQQSKEALNTASLLSSVYAFQLVSSKLLYDIIRDLIGDLSEVNAELLLKIVRNSGNQMRSDDPSALKEIVLQVNKSVSSQTLSPRMQFLVETIASLKNNKLKLENEASHQTVIRLKKFLGTFSTAKSDPLQVSLDDIRNVETKGKWWLVGSAWKGTEEETQELANIEVVNDVLDTAEPNWLELAKAQRMNTDIRRAIFISIMSANDYIDAVTKLDKLALKKAQEREIPRIVIHCAVVEPAWNPYYGILAAKLCDSHSYRKTFQFILWDLIKGFDGIDGDEDEDVFEGFDDASDDEKLKKILNLGRLFGHLFAEGKLALHLLRTVNYITCSSDNKLFLEVLLVTFIDQIGKKSQVNSIGTGLVGRKGMSEQKFDDRILIETILKAKGEPAMLQGMRHFMAKNLKNSDFVTGRKQKKRVEWGVKSMSDIIEEIVKEAED